MRTLLFLLLFLVACSKESGAPPPSVLQDFSFDTPCQTLGDYFVKKGFQPRGDPVLGSSISILMTHPVWRVLEVRCSRLAKADGVIDLVPSELLFFSGGNDETGALTRSHSAMKGFLTKKIGAEPWKKMQTARWDLSEWTGSPILVREYKTGAHDSAAVKLLFSRYPSNSVETLNARVRVLLEILEKETWPTVEASSTQATSTP
jgi:hypothetical protein